MKRTTTWVFASPVRPAQWPEPWDSRITRVRRRAPMVAPPALRKDGGCQREGQGPTGSGAGRRLRRRSRALFLLLAVFLGTSLQAQEPMRPEQARAPLSLDAQPCAPRPGQAPDLVVIPSGRFLMGAPEGEQGADPDESPQHGVSVVRPFALSRCEVMVGEFRAFVEDTGYRTEAERLDGHGCFALKADGVFDFDKGRDWRNPGFEQDERHPVVCVSWNDAEAYVRWLSLRTGQTYRLPSEAEWEYAARALAVRGVPGVFPRRYYGEDSGDSRLCDFANGADRSLASRFAVASMADCEDGYVFTAPAGRFRRNAFGLADMLGNVWEWTADCWRGSYANAPVDGAVWREADDGDCGRRVVRGGGWYFPPEVLRAAFRNRFPTDAALNLLGFRVARAF